MLPLRSSLPSPHHSSCGQVWSGVTPVGGAHRTARPHTAMINASPAGRHKSTVYKGVITLPSFPMCATFGLNHSIGDFEGNIESSHASVPVEAQPGGVLRLCPRQRTAVPLMVCRLLDSP